MFWAFGLNHIPNGCMINERSKSIETGIIHKFSKNV